MIKLSVFIRLRVKKSVNCRIKYFVKNKNYLGALVVLWEYRIEISKPKYFLMKRPIIIHKLF